MAVFRSPSVLLGFPPRIRIFCRKLRKISNEPKDQTQLKECIASHNFGSCSSEALMGACPATSYRRYSSSANTPDTRNQSHLKAEEDESDKFGTLSASAFVVTEDSPEDEELYEYEKDFVPLDRKTQGQFLIELRQLLKDGKLKEALVVFEKQMPVDKQRPDKYIYGEMMTACARVGYFDKVFEIYKKMTDTGVKPSNVIFTILFNACANSPLKAQALDKALYLRMKLQEENMQLNRVNYHSMIKAFARLGESTIAFQLVDEMMKNRILPDATTFSFLLQAALSDKKEGFKLALVTWHKLLKIRIEPDAYLYNLLIRIIRECSIGSEESFKDTMNLIETRSAWQPPPPKLTFKEKKLLSSKKCGRKPETGLVPFNPHEQVELVAARQVVPPKPIGDLLNFVRNGQETPLTLNFKVSLADLKTPELRVKKLLGETLDVPNLMARNPNLKGVVDVSNARRPMDRLAVCGGMLGFLKDMSANNVQPDLKIFMELMQNLPNNKEDEELLLEIMKASNIEMDIDFCNVLIKKRAISKRSKEVDDVVEMISEKGLRMNIVTFGTLALAATTKARMSELLKLLQLGEFKLNHAIVGALVSNATFSNSWDYIIAILQLCRREGLKPNAQILGVLENFRSRVLSTYKSRDKGSKISKFFLSEDFQTGFRKFSSYYKSWLQDMEVEVPEHPWNKYKYTDEDVKAIVRE